MPSTRWCATPRAGRPRRAPSARTPNGKAYVILTTALRRGEYDAIRIVRARPQRERPADQARRARAPGCPEPRLGRARIALGSHPTSKGELDLRRITWILVLGLAVLALGSGRLRRRRRRRRRRHRQQRDGDPRRDRSPDRSADRSAGRKRRRDPDRDRRPGRRRHVGSHDALGGRPAASPSSSSASRARRTRSRSRATAPRARPTPITGGEAEVTVDLQPGEYTYFCPVGDHAETMTAP